MKISFLLLLVFLTGCVSTSIDSELECTQKGGLVREKMALCSGFECREGHGDQCSVNNEKTIGHIKNTNKACCKAE